MDLAERISTLRWVNGLSARQLAALVDVAPTTVTRIESGAVSPALDPSLDVAVTDAVESWRQRWAWIGLVDASGVVAADRRAELLFRAGRAARLTRRPAAVHFKQGPSAHEVSRALTEAGVEYALTGDAGANIYRSSAAEAWPVLYVSDIAQAAEAAGLSLRAPGSFGMRVTLIPFDRVSEVGRTVVHGVTVAARDQVILDAYGGIDRMAEQADILLGRRVA